MKELKRFVVAISCLLLAVSAFAQEKYTISGTVRDEATGEELIGVSVFVKELTTGAATNFYGFYSITLPEGTYTVQASYLGFDPITEIVELNQNVKLDFDLKESVNELEEIVIESEREDANVKEVEMSVNKLDIKTIEKIPALLGEVDVVRSIQLLPGVTTVGEGASGFNVRGGGVDQNLILLDEAPVYNSSHLFGFFSVFNPDAVKNVKLIKGGIPSQYGGRLSSLLDVRMKEGNQKRLSGSGGVGAIFSRLTLEGPILKDKASFIIAGRRSYVDVLAKPFLNEDLKDAQFYFYDLTAKVNYRINDKNRLFLSSYMGRDVFGAGFAFKWGNTTATARWNHVFSDRLFMNATAFYSNYDYEIGTGEAEDDAFNWNSKIINYSVKPEWTFYPNPNNTIRFGGQSIYYDFKPGDANFTSGGQSNDISLPDKYALESAIYIQNDQSIGPRIKMQYGLRWSMWQYLGKGYSYEFEQDVLGERQTLTNSTYHERNEVIEWYHYPEPRFSFKYDLNDKSSVKFSYNRMAQYIHLISNTAASTPLDVWTPSTNNIKPQVADQVATGYFWNFGDKYKFETSVEVYYKAMQNQLDYINNAELLLNEYFEGDLLVGKGRSYGMELYVKKSSGKFTGWVSYTLARSERLVEGINLNDWYPNKFDKTHNANLVLTYDVSKRFSVSSNFVLASGTPATFPTNRYTVQGWVLPHNIDQARNNFRNTPYHRLDLSATLENKKKKEEQRWESEWVFSVYNVYNRRNAFTIFFEPNETDPNVTQAVRYSVIGSIVPAVSYNFNF